MSNKRLKNIFVDGIALAVPLSVVIYVFVKGMNIVQKWITPIAHKLGIERILGEITLTVLAFIGILIIVLLLGLLMQFVFVATIRDKVEHVLLRFIPALHVLKSMLVDKLKMENATSSWKAVILYHGNTYNFAFKIEESKEMGVFFIIKGPSIQHGETAILNKKDYSYALVDSHDMIKSLNHFGIGSTTLIQKAFETSN